MLSISLLALSLFPATAAASKHCMCCAHEAHVGRCAFHDTGITCGAKSDCPTDKPCFCETAPVGATPPLPSYPSLSRRSA